MTKIDAVECRRITFRITDFAAALAVPEMGGMVRVNAAAPLEIAADSDARVVRVRSAAAPDRTAAIVLDDVTVCALLIRLCMLLAIPVPRRALKSVEFGPDALTLLLELTTWKTLMSAGSRP
ncbi:MAG TPA: hypothetical protein VHS58_06275 [Acetobacteraceae bacterium]|jgi:hypothetical protein|nr:hypothetical protein [Acetobacteraceae bacterium]